MYYIVILMNLPPTPVEALLLLNPDMVELVSHNAQRLSDSIMDNGFPVNFKVKKPNGEVASKSETVFFVRVLGLQGWITRPSDISNGMIECSISAT